MAIGYTRIIAKYDNRYFINWIAFISKEYVLLDQNKDVTIIERNGEEAKVYLLSLENIFSINREVVIKFWNANRRAIATTLDYKSGYFVTEYYGMDELLDEIDYIPLY